MPKRLTLAEQRALIKALPKTRMDALKDHCRSCEMRGEGIKDIMKSAGSALGSIAKEIGPTILKEIIVPLLKKKAGLGISLPGAGISLPGAGLKLAGQGKKKKARRKLK